MEVIGNISIPAKPPKYWMDAKQRDGITPAGAGRIWYRVYNYEKRLLAWLAAPEKEWKAYGLQRP